MQRALDASADERQRIAAALHDGVVQELAATSFAVAGGAEAAELRPASTSWPSSCDRPPTPSAPAWAACARWSSTSTRRPCARRAAGRACATWPPGRPGAGRGWTSGSTSRRRRRAEPRAAAGDVPDRPGMPAQYGQARRCDRGRRSNCTGTRHGVCLQVGDDGAGFDPAHRPAQHLGLTPDAETWPAAIGGRLERAHRPGGRHQLAALGADRDDPGAAGRRPPAGPGRVADAAGQRRGRRGGGRGRRRGAGRRRRWPQRRRTWC